MKLKDVCFMVSTRSGEKIIGPDGVIGVKIDGVSAIIEVCEDGYYAKYEFPTECVEIVESND